MKHGYHRHIILLPREPVVVGEGRCVHMCVQAGGRGKERCMHMCGGGRVCVHTCGGRGKGGGGGWGGGGGVGKGGNVWRWEVCAEVEREGVCSCMCGGGKEVHVRRGGMVEACEDGGGEIEITHKLVMGEAGGGVGEPNTN